MKIRICVFLLLALLASSCGASAPTPPSITLEDVQSTSMAGAFTALAETHAALPTNTRIPPTHAPTQTFIPSNTPEVSLTLAPSFTATLAAVPTLVPTGTLQPTATSQPTALAGDPCNKPLTSWQGPSTKIMIQYEYTPQSKNDKVVVSLWVMTNLKECGFLPSLSSGPVGQYSAIAYIDGKKDFRVYGGFRLTEGSWDIIIRNDTIVAKGGCYPNC
jgi:hypothetical protein